MKAEQLIGKKVIRTGHTTYAGGTICRSFMDYPIKILVATDSHIIYQYVEESKWHNDTKTKHILPYEYCDNNWINYDCLMFMAEKPRNNATIYEDEITKVA